MPLKVGIGCRWMVTGMALAIAFAMGIAPTAAYGGQRRCASDTLPVSEKDAAVDQMQRIKPKNVGQMSIDWACWNSDFAIAWFVSPTKTDPDQVRWWWSIRCGREIGKTAWSCEPPETQRRLDVTVSEDGSKVVFVATLPAKVSADLARAVVSTSASLAGQKEMPLPACKPSAGDAEWWKRVAGGASSFRPSELDAQIESNDTGLAVELFQSLRFDFDPSGKPMCWGVIVVVT